MDAYLDAYLDAYRVRRAERHLHRVGLRTKVPKDWFRKKISLYTSRLTRNCFVGRLEALE